METLTFDVALLGGHNIILGLPWLQQHDLLIHWSTGKVTFTSDYCEGHCLAQPTSMFLKQCPLIQSSETIREAPEPEADVMSTEEINIYAINSPSTLVPMEGEMPDHYQEEVECFDGKKAVTTLPNSHKSDDFSIDLNPTKPFPRPSHPYHMNQEEQAECWKVLNEMLEARWAEPANSNCPMAAPMFFVWKKDRTCRLVINYRKLNEITIKDSYPLPHIDEMMDQIHRLKVFTKLNLKLGYNQI